MTVSAPPTIRKRFHPVRAALLMVGLIGLGGLGYLFWEPGQYVEDGRHDRGRNGIWLQHGWLGDDRWFQRNEKAERIPEFRDEGAIAFLAGKLKEHGFTDVYPHLCPCDRSGALAGRDAEQVERFLDGFDGFRVMPWIGGVHLLHAPVDSEEWRRGFVAAAVSLVVEHPRLAGVHVNIEPMPTGTEGFVTLLEELSTAMPDGKLLSVAAYPPPTYWHQVPDVHWDEEYSRAVAKRCDQMVVMMYDTALGSPKLYRQLMKAWTVEVIEWSGDTSVLLGLPAYDDAEVNYHDPAVENLDNALRGIHAGLTSFDSIPANYQGVALYSEWEMTEDEWKAFEKGFQK